MQDTEVSWAQAYERRMRKSNLEVILIALNALTARLIIGRRLFQR